MCTLFSDPSETTKKGRLKNTSNITKTRLNRPEQCLASASLPCTTSVKEVVAVWGDASVVSEQMRKFRDREKIYYSITFYTFPCNDNDNDNDNHTYKAPYAKLQRR